MRGRSKGATPRPETAREAAADPGVFALKLQFLFDTVRRSDGGRYTYREVLDGIEATGGPRLSIGYLSQLVTGVRANPMMDAVQGLARFFDVPITYFTSDDQSREADHEELKLAAALRNAGVQDLALRSVGLNENGVRLLLDAADRLRQMQGLPTLDEAGS